jgi:SAM-dependent methyltransferase
VADVVNPFVATRTVERYHHGRPYHHRRTLERILEAVPVRRGIAVDVAAGTGLSTRALAALGFDPVGVEPVPAMLALARHATGLPFAVGTGEALPVAGHVASLVTVSSAVHWFDQQRFFTEARRLLAQDGVLMLYDHAAVHLPDDERFAEWLRTDYVARYPAPARGTITGATGEPDGFRRCFHDTWVDTVVFTHEGLVTYLMTHSNVVEAIESGREAEDAVRSWLSAATAQYFSTSRERPFGFYVLAEALRIT